MSFHYFDKALLLFLSFAHDKSKKSEKKSDIDF